MTLHKEMRDAISEIQHVLNNEDEPFPLSTSNALCDAAFEMVNEHEHERDNFAGWSEWRQFAYAELGQLDSMPTRNHIHLCRRRRARGEL